MVGIVSSVRKEESTNFLILKVKPTANFASLQQVFLVENLNYTEQKSLNEETQKRLETKAVK
jgi:rod shape-determining protein MreC